MINSRNICITLVSVITLLCGTLTTQASVISFSGQLNYIGYDKGGVYSGTNINADFVGSIDDNDASGFISGDNIYTSFGCCMAAGGLSVSNNMTLTADDVVFLNEIAGFVKYSEGDIVDSINIEGDNNTASGGRIEIGISYILSPDTFDNNNHSNYPVEESKIELALFFIFEEDASGENIYYAGGKFNTSSSLDLNHLLKGEYYEVNYFSDNYTDFIDVTFDGVGGFNYQVIENSDSSPLESDSGMYTVAPDGEITITGDDNRGVLSLNDSFIFLVDLEGNSGLDLMIKQSSGLSNSILNGEYFAINYFSDDYADFMEVTFDGAGGFNYQMIENSDGSPLESGSGVYTVATDGQITIGDNKGVVSSDGNFIFTVDLSGKPGLLILVKKSSGLTTSILSGDHHSLNHFSDGSASFGEASFDGKGTMTYQQIQSINGSLNSGSLIYTVASDGEITISGKRGMVSPDGRIVFLTDLGSNPGLDIFVKRFNLYFPHIASSSVWETEICIINTDAESSLTGELKAYDNSGHEVTSTPISLPANSRREITVGDKLTNPGDIGYIIFESVSDHVCGYTKFYTEGKYRAALPATSDANSGDIYIPHIASGPEWWTGISIMNTTSAERKLNIEFDNGVTKTITVAAKEHKVFSIASLFNGVAQPNIRSGVIKNGNGIIGLELFGSSTSSVNSYLSGVMLKDDAATEIYYPHVVSSNKWWTGIVAYNPSGISSEITVTPFKSDGTALSSTDISLAPKGKYIGTAAQLNFPEETSWLQINATSPVAGFELFGTNNGKQLGGYTGVNISGTEGIFAKIEKEGWTGIAFVNTEDSPSTVSLRAYNDDGYQIAAESLNLTPYEKILGLAQGLFSQSIDGATYISYSSSEEIVGFQLNGSVDNMMLDGLSGM